MIVQARGSSRLKYFTNQTLKLVYFIENKTIIKYNKIQYNRIQ